MTVIFLGKKDVSETDLKQSPRYTFTRADLGKPQPSSSAQVDSGAVADSASAVG